MKRYLWSILLIVVILGVAGYYFYNKNAHDYKSCIRVGGQTGHDMQSGTCQINGKIYYSPVPKGMID